MVVRKRRKKNKLRGMRQHGAGDKKNRRGAGTRGGRGKAGSHKHKFSKYYTYFGVKITRKPKKKMPALNLDQISNRLQEWVKEGKAKVEDGFYVLDGKKLGFGKVLSKGNLKEKLVVVNAKVSEKASEKILQSGGKILEIGEEK
ncbi:MAG: uL15 family ribosomal protein [Candidatus Diapherotrites archaeon]